MSCPYLKEVRMVFCRAYPVKKPVPVDQVTTASRCDTECSFRDCALFVEARDRVERSAHAPEPEGGTPPADPKGGARS